MSGKNTTTSFPGSLPFPPRPPRVRGGGKAAGGGVGSEETLGTSLGTQTTEGAEQCSTRAERGWAVKRAIRSSCNV